MAVSTSVGNIKKRKAAAASSQLSNKKQKRLVTSANDLPWKMMHRPGEASFEGDDGILELEEVEGVEVMYEEIEGGRIVKFKVEPGQSEQDAEDEDASQSEIESEGDTQAESTTNSEEEDLDLTFNAKEVLPEWAQFNLHPHLASALSRRSFTKPTPIQRDALPPSLNGKDVVGVAETGSGKTLAYGLPILHRLLSQPRLGRNKKRELKALILAPTRELALQVAAHLRAIVEPPQDYQSKGKAKAPPRVSIAAVVGGMSVQKQRRVLDRGVDIIVATPGRLWDLLQEDDDLASQVKNLMYLVLDEADRMIEVGHFAELDNIVRLTLRQEIESDHEGDGESSSSPLPSSTTGTMQTFVFSATLSRDLQQNLKKRKRPKSRIGNKSGGKTSTTLDELLLKLDFRDPEPEVIDLSPAGGVVSTLKESQIDCLTSDKDAYLYYFLLRYPGRSLVFLSSIDGIRRLLPILELLQLKAFPLHSQLQQRQRLKNLDRFKSTPNSVLLATDIAARGLDIPSVDHVIHYQVPRSADAYIHRNGRTARASRDGFSLLMCAPDERKVVRALLTSLDRVGANEIPEMPIELDLLDKVKGRVQLSRKIDATQHRVKKLKHDSNWLRETAEAMEVEMDSDLAEEASNGQSVRQKAKAQQMQAMKAELKRLLSQPLVAAGAYRKYLTSGSRNIVEDLLSAGSKDALLGFKREDAKSDLMNCKKTKGSKRKQLKTESSEEWRGIDGGHDDDNE